ncbi:MAG: tetratricopeptide repeat protein [Bryobacteraceae bacterium]
MPLDAALLRTKAGFDDFVTEKYHDQIAAILAEWSASLLASPRRLQAIEKALADGFLGASLRPAESRIVRPGPQLAVHRIAFQSETKPGATAFLEEFRAAMSGFSKIVMAEFQVTRIDGPPSRLRTRVRYELVGAGQGFYREQRVGFWELEWETASTGEYRVRVWRMEDETRSRSARPCYADVTRAAFGANASYSDQLLHGVDYWRTVLDSACGIDIYGHNGVSAGDIDGDGFDDLYVCQPARLPNRLYRNHGDGTFEDITEGSGVGILENTACALFVDVDNDGRQDLVVVRSNGPLLFLNQGGGKFRLRPEAFQFAGTPQGTFTSAAAADYDRDGWLDIYFCLYVYYQGTDQYKYPVPYYDAENGPPNFLMRNNRDGTFRDVTAETGLDKNNTRYSFACAWNDYNRDGWPDLYVVNDFGRKNLYRNNGDGKFTDVAPQAGVEDVGAGMSVGWFDYDNDGAQDLYSADMWTAAGERISMQDVFRKDSPERVRALYQKHAMGNSLFRNSGDGTFQEVTASSGVGLGRWAWSSDAWDFDHDGFPDLYIANGMLSGAVREDLNSYFWRQVVANSPDEARASYDYEQGWNAINELIRADYTWSGYERNMFYANNRDGTFSDVSGAVGLDFLEDGRAFALADFDHDGRQEVFLKSRNAPQLRLLRNVMEELPPAIAIRLRGRKSNRDAIGAAITVETAAGRQTRILQAGSGFLSQHSKEVFFGLGTARGSVKVSIRWPSGLVQQLEGLPPNHRIWVEEGMEPRRVEAFRERMSAADERQESERLPDTAETWLLVPVSAPDFSLPDSAGRVWTLSSLRGTPVLLRFQATRADGGEDNARAPRWLQLLAIDAGGDAVRAPDSSFPVLRGSDDVAGVYSLLYRYLFDRHRDLILPTSFLIDEKGDIVKVYQGRVNPEHVEQDLRHIPRTTAERLSRALPFPGVSDTYEFARNYLSYGSVFFQRGYFDQAEAAFRLALRDDPSSAEALYGLGSVYLKLERASEARASFERAAKLPAGYPETRPNAFNNLGLLATRGGRTGEAIGYFQEALRVSPDHLIALQNLGNAYRQQKRWEEARKTLERALAVGPRDPDVNYSLGMVFAQTGDTERAYQYLRRALQLRPVYPEALNNLGVLCLRTERRDEAVAAFEESIRVAPAFDQSYLNLARVYSLEGHPEKARSVLLALLKQHPDHVEAQRALDQMR